MDFFLKHDCLDVARMVKSGDVSALEMLELAIDIAETHNPKYNFMAQRHYDEARVAIDRGLPNGPLAGVPFLLKDLNIYIAGQITEEGSRFFRDNRATVSSELVRRYDASGLVTFGRTTTPELGMTPNTVTALHGATCNPWNPDFIVGGSSGGSAAAVAAGVLPAAHATDGGGSIRIPASCCGLFGMKPSRGRIPLGPPRTEGWIGAKCSHVVSRSVRDSAAILDATHGIEPGARYDAPAPARPFLEEVARDPGRLRIALQVKPLAGGHVDPEVEAAVKEAARLCEALGHDVTEAAPAIDGEAFNRAFFTIMCASTAANLNERAQATGLKVSLEVIEPRTMWVYQLGMQVPGSEVIRANQTMQEAAWAVHDFLRNYDVILSPTLASLPLRQGLLDPLSDDVETYNRYVIAFGAYTSLYSGAGLPSMSVPLAWSSEGLPIGILFSGGYGSEGLLFSLAGQLERAQPWGERRPVLS
jgi:amidase